VVAGGRFSVSTIDCPDLVSDATVLIQATTTSVETKGKDGKPEPVFSNRFYIFN
jgi:hypothetical protein